jgi:hypothetical protein
MPGQQQQVVVALQVVAFRCCAMVAAGAMGMVVAAGEAFAPVVVFLQAVSLDHRAHRAVDDQDAITQSGEQQFHAFRVQPGQGGHVDLRACWRSAKSLRNAAGAFRG